MDIEELLEAEFGSDVRIERVAPDSGEADGIVRFTVYCSPHSRDRIRERVAELEADAAFETTR